MGTWTGSLRAWVLVVGLAISAAQASRAAATLIVVPRALDGVEGGLTYAVTFGITVQELIGTTQLNGLPAGSTLTGVQFRLDSAFTVGSSPACTFSSMDLSLGPATGTALGSDVAGNEGPGTVQVHSGPTTFAAGAFPKGGSPNAFGPVIPFTTPYTYTGGSLLLTVSYTAPTHNMVWDAGAGIADVDYNQADGYNQATLNQPFPGAALATQFTYVPEPASLPLLALITLPLVQRRQLAGAEAHISGTAR